VVEDGVKKKKRGLRRNFQSWPRFDDTGMDSQFQGLVLTRAIRFIFLFIILIVILIGQL